MADETLLWLILIATVLIAALMAPLAVMFHEEMDRAKARERVGGLVPLGYLVILLRGVMYAAWLVYAARTDQWLLFVIPVVAGLCAFAFKVIGRAAKKQKEAAS